MSPGAAAAAASATLRPNATATAAALRSIPVLPVVVVGSSVKDVVGAAKGMEVSVRAKANSSRVSSATSLQALPSSGVDVGSALIPRGSHAAILLEEATVAAPCKPKTPVTNMEGSDSMHSAPSGSDRAACDLGPLTVPVCKPLAFRVSNDTDKEIIHNSSMFESHGLICRFRGFWPSLPQLHTWISQSWEPILKGSVNIFPSAKGFFIAKFEYEEDRLKILCTNPFSWEDKFVLMVKP
ncbi:hypothetical protein SUGI_0812030 [Cryptomeria japonica]|nr:hypothetical protein SUGI_0812030 [Cryptomeria japonica]